MVFPNETLGLGLQCGEAADDLPVVSSAPPGLQRPGVGDVVESVNNVPLLGAGGGDAYSRAVELISTQGRPITIGFVAAPTTVYDLVFSGERLGISLTDRGEGNPPAVETNASGRRDPRWGVLAAIRGRGPRCGVHSGARRGRDASGCPPPVQGA